MTDAPDLGKRPRLHLKVIDGKVRPEGDLQFTVGHRLGAASASVQDGVYASWRWDGTALEIRNCRFGLYPLFYYCREGEFCVSTSLVELLECVGLQDFDDDAIAVFLRIGFFLEDDTPFRNQPGCASRGGLALDPGGIAQKSSKLASLASVALFRGAAGWTIS